MSFYDWYCYFQANQNHFSHIDWKATRTLSDHEREVIFFSIQQFQRGENSEGKHLLNRAPELESPDYVKAIKLFIKEEQTHARILGKFMEAECIPRIKKHWVDGVFRWLRSLAGLENSVMVLITAEIIAAVYYKALRSATQSPVLQSICDQILRDEEMHINFQSMALRTFFERKSVTGKWFASLLHRTLMTGTIFVVWIYHSGIYRVANYSFTKFESETMQVYFRSRKMITGREKIRIRKREDAASNSVMFLQEGAH